MNVNGVKSGGRGEGGWRGGGRGGQRVVQQTPKHGHSGMPLDTQHKACTGTKNRSNFPLRIPEGESKFLSNKLFSYVLTASGKIHNFIVCVYCNCSFKVQKTFWRVWPDTLFRQYCTYIRWNVLVTKTSIHSSLPLEYRKTFTIL